MWRHYVLTWREVWRRCELVGVSEETDADSPPWEKQAEDVIHKTGGMQGTKK